MAEFDTCPACGSEKRTRMSPISDPIEQVVCGDCGQQLSPVERHPGAAAHKECFTPFAKLVVTFHVLPSDMERVLQGLKAIPAETVVVEAPCNPKVEQSVSDLLVEVKAIRETVDLWLNFGLPVTTVGL